MSVRYAYRTYWFTSSIRYWSKRRFTTAGSLALVALLASGVLGLDTNRTMAHQAYAFLFALMVVSLVASMLHRGKFSATRSLPRYVTVGESLAYKIRLINQGSSPATGISVVERFTDPRPSLTTFLEAKEPGEEKRNRFDRYYGYYKWLWLTNMKNKALSSPIRASGIAPLADTTISMKLTPIRRGYVRFESVSILRMETFGLCRSITEAKVKDSILCLPKRYAMGNVRLSGRRKYNQGGVTMASRVGDSQEFISLRDYRPGDPLKNIHWKSWAKVGRPVVKEFQEEYFSRFCLALDTCDQPDEDTFEEAVSVAASFVFNVQTDESLLDLMFVGGESYCFSTGRSLSNRDKLLEVLATINIGSEDRFDTLKNSVIQRAGILNGCVLVLMSWDDRRKEMVKTLRALDVSVVVLIVSKDSADLPDPGPMKDEIENFHLLRPGAIEEGLAKL